MINKNNNFNDIPEEMKTYNNCLRITHANIMPGRFRNCKGETRFGNDNEGQYFHINLMKSDNIEIGNFKTDIWRPATLDDLREYGWRIKELPANPAYPDSEDTYLLKVKFDFANPYSKDWNSVVKVYDTGDDTVTELDSTTVGILDRAYIEKANLKIRPTNPNGRDQLRSAYVYEAHIYIRPAFVTSGSDWDE